MSANTAPPREIRMEHLYPGQDRSKVWKNIAKARITDEARSAWYSVVLYIDFGTLVTNGLSNHDAQLLTIKTKVTYKPVRKLKTVRKFNNCTMSDFINKLSNESCDTVFNSEDIYIV